MLVVFQCDTTMAFLTHRHYPCKQNKGKLSRTTLDTTTLKPLHSEFSIPGATATLCGCQMTADACANPSSVRHHRRFIIGVTPILTTVSPMLRPSVDVVVNQFFCKTHIKL